MSKKRNVAREVLEWAGPGLVGWGTAIYLVAVFVK